MNVLTKIRFFLLKCLDGVPAKEHNTLKKRHQALLDSKTDTAITQICNEYIARLLKDLVTFAKNELYGQSSDVWANKMFNVLHNNWLMCLVMYVHTKSSVIYKLDTALDEYNQVRNNHNDCVDDDDFFVLENDNYLL